MGRCPVWTMDAGATAMKRGFASYLLLFLFVSTLCTLPAHAHVGSKDVFEEVSKGPYKLFVTIRTPTVIPGVATVEVRSSGEAPDSIEATPTPMTGLGAEHPPTADRLQQSKEDPSFYTGTLWLMTSGSWEVRLAIHGPSGDQKMAIPIAASALSTLSMNRGVAITLVLLGLFLVVGMAGIFGAGVREARLSPGAKPVASRQRRALVVSALTVLVIGLILWRANKWWDVEAVMASLKIYHPLSMTPELKDDSLRLILGVPGVGPREEGSTRTNHDFIPDHGKMMHLYAIRQPEMDAAFHLHPSLHGSEFDMDLPQMPPGRYNLYGDVVHANGFPETLVGTINISPSVHGTALASDDAEGTPAPLSAGVLGSRYLLPDGYSMVWTPPATITVNTPYALHFRLLDPSGADAKNMQPYLGMAGHAAFVKTDGTVFAHVHPEGSAAMASLMLANNTTDSESDTSGMEDMPGMSRESAIKNVVEFPYGFPSAGRYRIFVQMKHDNTVETGAFDTLVR